METNKYNLITQIFKTKEEYLKFFVGLKLVKVVNEEKTCLAELEKMGDYMMYSLTWLKDGKFIGDYVKYFRVNDDNFRIFSEGCVVLAQRLEIYIDTNDVSKVPNDFPAFRELTYELESGE